MIQPRRYETAAEMGEDLERFCKDLPVKARRASVPERVVRWCLRNPWVAASLVFLALGTGISTWQAVRATAAERTAGKERDRAESEMEIAEAVNDFLNKDLLAQVASQIQAGPGIRPDPNLKVRTAVERAAGKVGARFVQKPLVEGSIRHTIGEAYFHLGLYAPCSRRHLERALELRRRERGEDHPDTLETLMAIGTVYFADGKTAQAAPLLIAARDGLLAARGDEYPQTRDATHRVAQLYYAQGKYRESEALLESLLETYQTPRWARLLKKHST